MKQILLFFICIFMLNNAYTQKADCKVLLDSLKGSYAGECKNGKANGTGKAIGVNTYEGEFKNGLPEGKGKYTWSSGNFYYGAWKNGKKDGKGEMHEFDNGNATLVKGYWKKDIYKGEYENPYVITNVTSEIGRVLVTKMSTDESTITITVEGLKTATSFSSSTFQTSTVMTSHQVTRGIYISKSSNANTNREITVFRGIEFPFRCTFNFGSSMIEIEFFEHGAWDVFVPINK